jgi:hypothetical protein
MRKASAIIRAILYGLLIIPSSLVVLAISFILHYLFAFEFRICFLCKTPYIIGLDPLCSTCSMWISVARSFGENPGNEEADRVYHELNKDAR